MKLKYAALILASTTLMSTAAYANTDTFSDADVQALFEGEKPAMQLAALSEQEMKNTEGAFGFGGAALGAGMYAASTLYDSYEGGLFSEATRDNFVNNWDWGSAGASTAAGFVGGGFSNAMFRGAGYRGIVSQATAPLATQAVIRGTGKVLGETSFGFYK